MKRVRPAIPDGVRIHVLLMQQLRAGNNPFPNSRHEGESLRDMRKRLERTFFGDVAVECDHVPRLEKRPYNPRVKNVAARYTPNANDPLHLVYRTKQDHHIKTNVRGDGAERSDTADRVHQRRLDAGRAAREAVRAGKPKRRNKTGNKKRRVCSWPTGRKLQSRNTFRDRR